MTGGNGVDPTGPAGSDAPGTLAELVEEVVARLGAVTRSESAGAVTFAREGRPFAGLEAGALAVRLPSVVTRAALRTPDTASSDRGPDWLRFAPAELDRFAVDRAVAWIESAWRHAVD